MKALSSADTWDINPFLSSRTTLFQSLSSIQHSGLMYLPLVRQDSYGTYELITGNRCVEIANALHPQETLFCRVLDTNIAAAQLLAILHAEHSLRGSLTIIEQAHFVRLACEHLGESEQYELFNQIGMTGTNQYALDRLLQLLDLETPLQAALYNGFLQENMARELLRLKKDDRQTFYGLIVKLGFGGGKQKRLLSLLKDLAGRNGVSFRMYLEQEYIRDILEHEEMNIPQKGQVLLQQLQQHHSPALSAAEEQFLNWKQHLDLPQNCTLNHSPSFEQDEVSLTVRFRDRRTLEAFLAKIRENH